MFRCLVFAGRDRSEGLAMAKNSFKLEHPLGLFSFFLYKNKKDLIFCDAQVFFCDGFCELLFFYLYFWGNFVVLSFGNMYGIGDEGICMI